MAKPPRREGGRAATVGAVAAYRLTPCRLRLERWLMPSRTDRRLGRLVLSVAGRRLAPQDGADAVTVDVDHARLSGRGREGSCRGSDHRCEDPSTGSHVLPPSGRVRCSRPGAWSRPLKLGYEAGKSRLDGGHVHRTKVNGLPAGSAQLGQEDAGFTLQVCVHAAKRKERLDDERMEFERDRRVGRNRHKMVYARRLTRFVISRSRARGPGAGVPGWRRSFSALRRCRRFATAYSVNQC